MVTGGINFMFDLEDDLLRYVRPGQGGIITVPPDATIADLQRMIMKAVELPGPLILLDNDCSSTGHVWYAFPETTLVSQVPQRNDGWRFVYIYPRRYKQVNLNDYCYFVDVFCKREEAVHTIYTRAKLSREDPFIVRGPLGSGKSTLLDLLSNYIMQEEPDANVFYVPRWTVSDSPDGELLNFNKRFSRLASVSTEFIEMSERPAWLLMDDMENSYWDRHLWQWINDAHIVKDVRIIIFCRYGCVFGRSADPTAIPLDASPKIFIDRRCHMGLQSTEDFPFGLYFSQTEFSEYVQQRRGVSIDEDLERCFFLWTNGHIGAITALYGMLQKASLPTQPLGNKSSLADFEAAVPSLQNFTHELGDACELKKGLPPQSLLTDVGRPSFAAFFRRLLKHGSLLCTEGRTLYVEYGDLDQWVFLDDPINGDTCLTAIRQGWVFSSPCGDFGNTVIISLSTPLLQCWFSQHLIPCELEASFESPLDFVCQVTALFCPFLLRDPPVRFNSPLESRYHMEFYRAASALTDSAVVLSPDFATNPNRDTRGQIDFLLAHKKWGIELTRDGNRLDGGRNLRLENYAQWLEEGDMTWYIFVDYRVTRPVHSHPDIRHLYHVVLDEKFEDYVILQGSDLSVICHGCLPKM
ncbi:uncharacterized protein ARMOST_12504 [Armillaria ostoyae]|uniref:Uncharacterized protein n=1 Tax=Armillaria ostoyae TaxID=47428 RepID=A0A284RK41_ARMOS|nr:uncharacterized protein ARMOST_12504 [Armillaria ostoyae]